MKKQQDKKPTRSRTYEKPQLSNLGKFEDLTKGDGGSRPDTGSNTRQPDTRGNGNN